MSGTRLILHAGAHAATLEQVEAVPLPMPTDTFQPVPHLSVYQAVRRELESVGLRVQDEAHALGRDGQRYFGLLRLTNGAHADYSLAAGIRNTHDQSFAASLAIGSYVFVCDNLAFSGEVLIARKHTRYIERDFPQLVNRAVGLLTSQRGRLEERIRIYKETEVSDLAAHDLLIHALDSRVVPVTKLPLVLAQWRKPNHEEFAPRTAWSLFNGFTEVLKSVSPFELGRRTIALHGLLDRFAGLGKVAGFEGEAKIEGDFAIAEDGDLVDARDL